MLGTGVYQGGLDRLMMIVVDILLDWHGADPSNVLLRGIEMAKKIGNSFTYRCDSLWFTFYILSFLSLRSLQRMSITQIAERLKRTEQWVRDRLEKYFPDAGEARLS